MIVGHTFLSEAVALVAHDSINDFLEPLDRLFHFVVLPYYTIFKRRQDNKC
jgi:hypothetical protein